MIIEERTERKTGEEKEKNKLVLENRNRLNLNGVEDVESFSESSVTIQTNLGRLLIRGEKLHISKIDTDGGDFAVDGRINSLEYLKKSGKKGSFLENIFK